MLMQRRPRTEVVPAKIPAQAENIRRLLSFRRSRLENRVVDADVFTLGIQEFESRGELASAVVGGDFLQQGRRLRQMFFECVYQCLRAPQKHPTVPIEISGAKKFFRSLKVRFLGKPAYMARIAAGQRAR